MVMKYTKQQIGQEGGFAYQVFISAILVSSYFCCYLYNWNWIHKTAKSTAVVRKHCCMLHGGIHMLTNMAIKSFRPTVSPTFYLPFTNPCLHD